MTTPSRQAEPARGDRQDEEAEEVELLLVAERPGDARETASLSAVLPGPDARQVSVSDRLPSHCRAGGSPGDPKSWMAPG